MRATRLTVIGLSLLLLAGCGEDEEKAEEPRQAAPAALDVALKTADGADAGAVTLTDDAAGVRVEAELTGLEPGFHGFHVHAVGKCDAGAPNFGSAGGHLVVGTQAHPAHAGDQPAVLVLGDGTAEIRFATDRYKLSDLLTAEGRAMIVHANPDNYGNIPTRYAPQVDDMTKATGDAGDRLACGVLKRS